MRIFSTLICVGILCLHTILADTGLTFETNRKDVSVEPDAADVFVPFHFKNNTEREITIAKYDTACSCLKTKIKDNKMTYAPGESGEALIHFDLGNFSGTVNKSLMLWTTEDKPEKPSDILTVYATIPELFKITPVTTTWETGEEAKTKTVKIKVSGKSPIQLKSHNITNKNFTYEITPIKKGWEYQIDITPKLTGKSTFGIIKLKTDSAIKRYKNPMVFAVVKKP